MLLTQGPHLQSSAGDNAFNHLFPTGNSYLQRSSYKTISWILKRNLAGKRGWKEVFEVMKGKDLHPRLLYPAKLSFRMEGQMKCFPDKVKLKEFIMIKPLIYEMLKGNI